MNWISTKEDLPQHFQDVLFCNTEVKDMSGNKAEVSIHSGWHEGGGKFRSWVDQRDRFTATHWMPLPKPPNTK